MNYLLEGCLLILSATAVILFFIIILSGSKLQCLSIFIFCLFKWIQDKSALKLEDIEEKAQFSFN